MTTYLLRTLVLVAALFYGSRESFAGSVFFDVEKTGSSVLQPAHLAGTCLPIWNKASLYAQIKPGLAQSNYRLFRFPNGTLSNGYHWNGTGSYTADSIWVCDSLTATPGFMSKTLHRGTSVENWGFRGCSNITDGDTATWWRSDDLIAGTDPYFYLELPKALAVDSIVIIWGERYAVDFAIDFFTLANCPYPGPFGYPVDLWENRKTVTDNTLTIYEASIPDAEPVQYVRVTVKKFKDGEKSVEVKEAVLYSQGAQVSKNVSNYAGGGADNQTRVIAMPTFIGNTFRDGFPSTSNWYFDSFMEYIQTITGVPVPVISVNYGTGTPEEAAAWVHYANVVKKYGVRFWQVGNEPDGHWEDGGPVNPRIYAEKFLLFAKAMKGADPSIKVFGPLLSNAWFTQKNSGLYDGNTWMKVFIDIVGAAEKADNRKYCDGIDFHSYPYWEPSLSVGGMLATIDDVVYGQLDSLTRWIDSSMAEPESVYVMMSEFNSSTILSDLLQKPVNGLYVVNLYAGLAEKFGGRAMSVFWDSFEDGGEGSNGTFGSLSLFNGSATGLRSSLAKPPSAAYWALFAAQNLWIDPEKNNTVVTATVDSAKDLRAYGITTDDDFRVLLLNFSLTSETVSCTVPGDAFSIVDVYSWGENQFLWQGSNSTAFAFPNCGPVSKTVARSDVKSVTVPGLSLCVLRYRDTASVRRAPRFLHLLSATSSGAVPFLPICGSVSGGGSAITAIDYAFDSAAVFSIAAQSIDGSFDGPFESFFDSVALNGLSSGNLHVLYIRVRNAAGDSIIDSVSFWFSSLKAEDRHVQKNRTGWKVTEKISGSRISLVIDPPVRADRRIPLTARVIAVNGACVKELTGKGAGGRVIEWAGESGVNGKAAPGVYFLVVSAGGENICRTTVMRGY